MLLKPVSILNPSVCMDYARSCEIAVFLKVCRFRLYGVLSGLEKFEGPDPAEFVPKGFAIVNVDARGSGDSDGSVTIMGTQEAEDGYDVIETLAKLPWCNGSIGPSRQFSPCYHPVVHCSSQATIIEGDCPMGSMC